MRHLEMPLKDTTAEDIFCECLNHTRKGKTDLEKCIPLIATDSLEYSRLAMDKLHTFHYSECLPEQVDAKMLENIYDRKLARADAPKSCRQYYEAILYFADDELCPICGVADASTLDHYLPKSIVPTLAVTPANLIPICPICNKAKFDFMDLRPGHLPIHLYFDEVPQEPWLSATLANGDKLVAKYEVRCPENWEPILRQRMEQHLDLYKLKSIYRKKASRLLSNQKRKWRQLLLKSGDNALKYEIGESRISAEEYDLNSWESALYRALEVQFELLLEWLE